MEYLMLLNPFASILRRYHLEYYEALLCCVIYFLLISLYAIFATVYDKWCAKHRKRRVSEFALLLTAMLGGALPMYITMRSIHHKTHKLRFMAGLPLMIIMHLLLIGMGALLIYTKRGSLL